MKLNFYRQGFANNSSSSHSIIFTDESKKLNSTEDVEFGWQFFTCSDKKDKLNYFLICLYCSWEQLNTKYKSYTADQKDWDIEVIRSYNQSSFVEALCLQKDLWRLCKDIYGYDVIKYLITDLLVNGIVDHQSQFTFPKHRINNDIEWGFALDWIKEILNDRYAILGGHDNEDNEHTSKALDINDKNDVKLIYQTLAEVSVKELTCVKDTNNNEWFISHKRAGDILKVSFNN